jgi:catechol 2,3-dioxygenase-like lactoylglutathione lyase family enzyme
MLVAYTMIGTSDIAKAVALYTPVMDILGAKKIGAYSTETRTWFGRDGAGMLAIGAPGNGEAATAGNGTMIALSASDTATVHAAHAKALELGASDEGAAGPRGPGFYGAYFRDFDGNKICIFTLVAS